MNRKSGIFLAAVTGLALWMGMAQFALAAPSGVSPAVSPALSKTSSRSIYQAKSSWENQNAEKVTLVQLRGSPVVVAMIFTSCRASCPLMMSDLKALEKGLSPEEQKRVKFAVFAFDSKNDVPAQLKSFAKKHEVDLARWTFFHGSPASVRELAALLGVKFKLLDDGGIDHSNVITVLDSEGEIVHRVEGLRQKPDESIQVLRRLLTPSPLPKIGD
jgi:protein SCO1/2